MATAAARGLRAWPSRKPAARRKPPRSRREMAMERPFNVLFLCTGNSARSIMAEATLNREGRGNFRSFSAGSQPKGQVHPYTLDLLRKLNFDVSALRSKSWTEFSGANAAPLDFVFTVCDNAAGEACPYWPGQPMTAHWGVPDPAAATGNEAQIRLAFADTFRMLSNRISLFVSLPLRSLDKLTLQRQLDSIGTSKDWAPQFWSPPSSAPASWRSGLPAATTPSRCCATPYRPARSWSFSSPSLRRSPART